MMNLIEELRWRGMIQDFTPEVEEHLAAGMRRGYIGFDPTAPSVTIGNYVQVMLLTHLQRAGHQPVVLMGGATGRIGDPSGKDKERDLKSYEELDANLERQVLLMRRFLDFDRPGNPAILVNNLDFYRNMNALDYLRDVGKTLTVNYMLSKESVQKRMETGISYTEFSYQILQGYDFQVLFEHHGVTVQMGGSDQWGNIIAGVEFIRRNLGEKAFAFTTPLLTKADGTKFGKSETGNIWMDGKLTSPYKFYQFWINADDRDLPKLYRYFSLKSREEIETLERENDPQTLKRILAEELTIRIHGVEEFESVLRVSEMLFGKNADAEALYMLSPEEMEVMAAEIPHYPLSQTQVAGGIGIIDLLAGETPVLASKSEARKAVQNNAISVNKKKIASHEAVVGMADLLHGRYLLLENGKKNKYMITIS